MVNRKKKGKSQRGFTLIELMVSVAILGLVLLGSLAILTEAHQMTEESRHRFMAANAARSVLETIKDTPLALVSGIATAPFIPADLPGGAIVIITNPNFAAGVTLSTVTVRVTWTNPKGLPGIVEITTMRSIF